MSSTRPDRETDAAARVSRDPLAHDEAQRVVRPSDARSPAASLLPSAGQDALDRPHSLAAPHISRLQHAPPTRSSTTTATRLLSIIVPLYNEVDNVPLLCQQLRDVAERLPERVEILLVDDGSRDGTDEAIRRAAATDPRIKAISFCRNFGQTAAMMAGIDHAAGDVLIPMDGDLQNDPADIPRLLAKLDEGYDVVSGWRQHRQDAPLRRNLPSRIANRLVSAVTGVRLHDYGCSLKAYRSRVIKGVRLYGEMHRLIPVYASWQGARVAELPVHHRARRYGQSKYGLERVFKLLLDLLVVRFLASYHTKPIYLFGGCGLVSLGLAVALIFGALYTKLATGAALLQTAWPTLIGLATMGGVMCLLMGLLAELVTRTYYESQRRAAYQIDRTWNLDGD